MASSEKYYAVVETMTVENGRTLKAMKPDSDGYFIGVPVAVFGGTTRAGITYDFQSSIKAMTDPKGRFSIALMAGSLIGCADHPIVRCEADLVHQFTLLNKEKSHHIRKAYVSNETLPDCSRIVYCDLKPCGPYGPALYESLVNPYENTSFSVRSMCKEHVTPEGKKIRYINMLLTFDSVDCGGFSRASKRYSLGNEAFEVTPEMLRNMNTSLLHTGNESMIVTDDEFVTMFGRKCVNIQSQSVELTQAQYLAQTGIILDSEGKRRSITHAALKM